VAPGTHAGGLRLDVPDQHWVGACPAETRVVRGEADFALNIRAPGVRVEGLAIEGLLSVAQFDEEAQVTVKLSGLFIDSSGVGLGLQGDVVVEATDVAVRSSGLIGVFAFRGATARFDRSSLVGEHALGVEESSVIELERSHVGAIESSAAEIPPTVSIRTQGVLTSSATVFTNTQSEAVVLESGTATLRRSVVDGSRRPVVRASGGVEATDASTLILRQVEFRPGRGPALVAVDGSTLDGEDVVVRGFGAIQPDEPGGLFSGTRSSVIGERWVLFEQEGLGMLAETEGRIELSDARVSATRERDDKEAPPAGVAVFDDGFVRLTDCELADNDGVAAVASRDTSDVRLELERCAVLGTREDPNIEPPFTRTGGIGVIVRGGAVGVLRDVFFSDNGRTELFLTDGSQLETAERLEFARSEDVPTGIAVSAFDVETELHDIRISGAYDVGLGVVASTVTLTRIEFSGPLGGTELRLPSEIVADGSVLTVSELTSTNSAGSGLVVDRSRIRLEDAIWSGPETVPARLESTAAQQGSVILFRSRGRLERIRAERSSGFGLSLTGPGTSVSGSDLLIVETRAIQFGSGLPVQGVGLQVASGAEVSLNHVEVAGGEFLGLGVFDEATGFTGEHIRIRGVRRIDCTMAPEGCQEGGIGATFFVDPSVDLNRFILEDNEFVGLQLGQRAGLVARDGLVRANRAGLRVDETFDASILADEVRFIENETRVLPGAQFGQTAQPPDVPSRLDEYIE